MATGYKIYPAKWGGPPIITGWKRYRNKKVDRWTFIVEAVTSNVGA